MKVFISHSSDDVEIVTKVKRGVRNTEVEPVFAEFRPDERPPFNKIHRMMIEAEAAFLLLTPRITSNEYTQNWVSYEVGLAHALDKNVYVFEEEFNNVRFPIPYFTNYFLYNDRNALEMEEIDQIAKRINETDRTPLEFAGLLVGATLGASFDKSAIVEGGKSADYRISVTCPHEGCGVEFELVADFHPNYHFNCPSCRRDIEVLSS